MAYSDIDRRRNIWFYNCLMNLNLNWNFSCDPIVVSELKNSKIEYIIPDFTYFHDAVDHTSVWTLNPENTSDRSWKLLYVRSEHSKILRITFFANIRFSCTSCSLSLSRHNNFSMGSRQLGKFFSWKITNVIFVYARSMYQLDIHHDYNESTEHVQHS